MNIKTSYLDKKSPISIFSNVGYWCRTSSYQTRLWGIRHGFFLNKTNRAKIKSSHLVLIFQCTIFAFCTFLLGIAMVRYCAVAVCRDGTRNRPDLAYFAFAEDNARQRKWIMFCTRAVKMFKSLVDLLLGARRYLTLRA